MQTPQKHFYRIGEVSRLIDVPAHVLRYWEGEFPGLKPQKGSGGQRLYKQADIALLKSIKSLLYEQGFTIDGARKALNSADSNTPTALDIQNATAELRDIAALLG